MFHKSKKEELNKAKPVLISAENESDGSGDKVMLHLDGRDTDEQDEANEEMGSEKDEFE